MRTLSLLCEADDFSTAYRHDELRAFSVYLRDAPC